MSIYYHATKKEKRELIMNEGLKLMPNIHPRNSDYGDGIYFHDQRYKVEQYGDLIIEVEIDDNLLLDYHNPNAPNEHQIKDFTECLNPKEYLRRLGCSGLRRYNGSFISLVVVYDSSCIKIVNIT